MSDPLTPSPTITADPEEVARTLRFFASSDTAIEIRAPHTKLGTGNAKNNLVRRYASDDIVSASKEACRLSGKAPAVYFVLNGVNPSLELGNVRKGAEKDDIPRRRFLLIDCDPIRPADCSSTDVEKEQAAALAGTTRDALRARGWPDPVIADSGNGYHLLYAVDLPNDGKSTELIQAVLKSLALKYDTNEAKVDRKVFDAPRLVKLYGTLVAKGRATAERPHRYSFIYDHSEPLLTVKREQLEELADEVRLRPIAKANGRAKEWQESGTSGNWTRENPKRNGRADRTAEKQAIAYLRGQPPAISGQNGHDTTFAVACNVGPGFDLDPDTAYRLLRDHYNERCEPPWSEDELRHKIDDAYKNEPRRGWLLDKRSRCKLTCAADVIELPLEFLWKPRVLLGMLNLFAGDPKLGKSFVTIAMAAAVTRGRALPGGAIPDGPGSVILLSAEDDPARTIVPRLKTAGADLSKIYILESVHSPDGTEGLPSLSRDILAIESAIASHPDCRLIVIDPVTAYLGGTDDHRNAELRGVLTPLKQLAERLNVAVVLVTHLNKSTGTNGKLRVTGSIAYVGTCRANFLFVKDKDDPTGRRVLMLDNGCNLVGDVPGLAYRIEDRGDGPAVEWEDEPVATTVEQALSAETDEPGAGAEALDCNRWLRATLANGPVLQKDVASMGKDAGFTPSQLKRSKRKIGAKTDREGYQGKCYWTLAPAGSDHDVDHREHIESIGGIEAAPQNGRPYAPNEGGVSPMEDIDIVVPKRERQRIALETIQGQPGDADESDL